MRTALFKQKSYKLSFLTLVPWLSRANILLRCQCSATRSSNFLSANNQPRHSKLCLQRSKDEHFALRSLNGPSVIAIILFFFSLPTHEIAAPQFSIVAADKSHLTHLDNTPCSPQKWPPTMTSRRTPPQTKTSTPSSMSPPRLRSPKSAAPTDAPR